MPDTLMPLGGFPPSLVWASLATALALECAVRASIAQTAGEAQSCATRRWVMAALGLLALALAQVVGSPRARWGDDASLSWGGLLALGGGCVVAHLACRRMPWTDRALAGAALALGGLLASLALLRTCQGLPTGPQAALGLPALALILLLPALTWVRLEYAHRPSRQGPLGRGMLAGLVSSVVGLLTQLSGDCVLPGAGLGLTLQSQAVPFLATFLLLLAGSLSLQAWPAQPALQRLAAAPPPPPADATLGGPRDESGVDALTGVPQRSLVERQLAARMGVASDRPAVVLCLDIDGFRAINHSYGRRAGDALLADMVLRLREGAGEHALVGRVGVDEFVVVGNVRPSLRSVSEIAQRLQTLVQQPYRLPGGEVVNISCCVGTAMSGDALDACELIDHADAAKQAAKALGSATIAAYEPHMAQRIRDQVALRHDLKRALVQGELSLQYQPKVDAGKHLLVGVEALARWRHPTRGSVSPTEFIAVAERFGLIAELGDWVLGEACSQIVRWRSQGLRMRVAINVSAQQLRQPDLAQRMQRTIADHGVDPALLVFEITETAAMADTALALDIIQALGKLGSTVALDDFGTGYSSLGALRQLPAEQIKLDRSFVVDLEHSAEARAMVDAVIRLAHALGRDVVAEGVETAEQVEILEGLGCDQFQGYYFARPMTADGLQHWMEDARDNDSLVGFRPSTFMPF